MGMAAGQARLLSITSRMSDNELRAQIISNNKMRLATQSSQVSENYVTALNKAQMMFTNYDADNNTSYQQLTFNALSAYNPYNNQYILSNASGQVVLSETDAQNYVNANGSVNAFLAAYGLENTTSYFESLETHMGIINAPGEDANGKMGIPYKTGIIEDGKETRGYFYADGYNSTATLAKYIQDLYEGNFDDKTIHPGYKAAMASDDYYNYSKALGEYLGTRDAYLETVAQLMSEKLEALADGTNTLDAISKAANPASGTPSANTLGGLLENLANIIQAASAYSNTDEISQKYFKDLKDLALGNKGSYSLQYFDSSNGDLEYAEASIPAITRTLTFTDKDEDDSEKHPVSTFTRSGDGVVTAYTYTANIQSIVGLNADGNIAGQDEDIKSYAIQTESNVTGTDNGDGYINFGNMYMIPKSYFDSKPSANWKIGVTTENTPESMQAHINQIITSLRSSIYSVWNPSHDNFKPTKESDWGYQEYENYKNCAKALAKVIFGSETAVSEDQYASLDDIEWCHDKLKTNTSGKKDAFEKIYDIYILDCIQNTYGEPKYAWIDTSSPKASYNENGDAKAQWYENLFKRVQKGGFTVLKDGLASSTEWIQFAFESGVVTMEQLDELKNWQPLIYSNCSDITEKTCDAEIAKAEAEYKSAMNKIENKDKRYDLELKNIDTEHNSLQTEYDSIKTAIDKNIDRTFKLYM